MQMKYVTQIIVEELNTFWGRLFTYNHALMKRSEDEELFGTESFTDIIDFYLTSQASTSIRLKSSVLLFNPSTILSIYGLNGSIRSLDKL